MSEFKEFICESTLENPRTITYRDWTIVSTGQGRNRYIYLTQMDRTKMKLGFYTDCYYACFIHSVVSDIPNVYYWLNATNKNEDVWTYETWEDVDKLMFKICDFIRNKS